VSGLSTAAPLAGSAYASNAENSRGAIAPGMLADLVILSEDPTRVSPDRIGGLQVLATFVAGTCRHDATGGQLR
jgi:predicted amidohydrolase YtcJ